MGEEHWVKAFWRPAIAWLYVVMNAFDFIVFPLLSMILPVISKLVAGTDVPYAVWVPLTLQNGGFIHLSFAAILGVAAWTRGQEKIETIKTP